MVQITESNNKKISKAVKGIEKLTVHYEHDQQVIEWLTNQYGSDPILEEAQAELDEIRANIDVLTQKLNLILKEEDGD